MERTMTSSVVSLWPDDLGVAEKRAPVAILREQAALLGDRTNGLVLARVDGRSRGPLFVYDFYLVVPCLDHYRFLLFNIRHQIEFYPLELEFDLGSKTHQAASEEEFIEVLADVFSSPETRRVVASLLAQAMA